MNHTKKKQNNNTLNILTNSNQILNRMNGLLVEKTEHNNTIINMVWPQKNLTQLDLMLVIMNGKEKIKNERKIKTINKRTNLEII